MANVNGLLEIISGLGQVPVFRLDKTWEVGTLLSLEVQMRRDLVFVNKSLDRSYERT